mmetsp:Transcript_48327/g.114568  ORF Transcript_48327/g.114568 Transcript_48327/m.114568 type:complete len:268 (-) Transcript_48327:1909-2712(-)
MNRDVGLGFLGDVIDHGGCECQHIGGSRHQGVGLDQQLRDSRGAEERWVQVGARGLAPRKGDGASGHWAQRVLCADCFQQHHFGRPSLDDRKLHGNSRHWGALLHHWLQHFGGNAEEVSDVTKDLVFSVKPRHLAGAGQKNHFLGVLAPQVLVEVVVVEAAPSENGGPWARQLPLEHQAGALVDRSGPAHEEDRLDSKLRHTKDRGHCRAESGNAIGSADDVWEERECVASGDGGVLAQEDVEGGAVGPLADGARAQHRQIRRLQQL